MALSVIGWLAGDFAAAQPQAGQGDRQLLQGVWVVQSAEARGKPRTAEQIKDVYLVFVGDAVYLASSSSMERHSYKLNAAQKPKAIDLAKQGDVAKAIYELAGDQLKLALTPPPGKDRPTTFASREGSEQELLVLKRDTSAGAKELLRKAQAEEAQHAAKAKGRRELSPVQKAAVQGLRHIALAMHGYHDTYGRLPPAASYSKDGKPLLSWRVLLLPFLEQDTLYKAFKLDEPWDSPTNRKLLAQIPAVYAPVKDSEYRTPFQVLVGPGTLFEGRQGLRFQDVTDGTSNTIMVAEAAELVPWTKPADLVYDPQKPLPKFGGLFKEGFLVAWGDGSVNLLKADFDQTMMRRAITRNDGQKVDHEKLVLAGDL
jgi:uncharacterized protein (TIGR03067 family)